MKRITGLIVCICLAVMMFTGCAKSETKPESDTPTANTPVSVSEKEGDEGVDPIEQYIDFSAQYIRTDGYIDGEKYPKTVWITSVSEIEEYYNENKDKYYLESIENSYSDQTIGFQDAVKKYDDTFFENHDLLFVILEEDSGSIHHEVTGVKVIPAQNNQYTLQPEINRLTPECGTDDMAEWHIMIEIRKEYGKSAAETVTPLLNAGMLTEPETEGEPTADTVSVVGPYGQISVNIPATWTAEAAHLDSDKMMYGLYGLILKPRDAASGQIELFCSDSFGVCGTGLSEEKVELAGHTANVGTYDNHAHWDFIAFRSGKVDIVAQHTDCSSWTSAMWDEAMSVLDTVKFDESITEGKLGSNGKELLRIQRFSEENEDNTNLVEPETRQISIAYDTLPEMPVQKFESNDNLKTFTDYIKDELGIAIDEHWTVVTHFYDSDMTVGMLKFQYWIGNIATNKTILFNLDNGKADLTFYSMLNEDTDEDSLLERVRLFEERYEQEKRELKDNEIFVSEDVIYSFYYNTGNLVYTYTLFFSYGEDGVLNNEYGTECYIDENGYALAMK